MASISPGDAALLAGVFALAGIVKGLAGFGFPTVVVGALALTRGVPEAIALMLLPTIATNVWQALVGGWLLAILRRLGLFLAAAVTMTVLTAGILAEGDAAILSGMLGLVLVVYATAGLAAFRIPPPGARERWLSPLMGGIAGAVMGLTGSFSMPGVPYLQALAMPRDMFIQSLGVAFVSVTFALAVALVGHGVLRGDVGLISLASLVPSLAGMALGQWLRRWVPEHRFRQIVYAALGTLGVHLAVHAFA
jgi:uncharacterized membrane protein YfcA